ncbi:MAG TPA: hypothetical protein P5228_01175 [Bacteroidales bacterium]|nr:hypothetical protein [Bacteroidales bacterium]HRZ49159.1 hypothetical protein [Bacteroidales bacterium]
MISMGAAGRVEFAPVRRCRLYSSSAARRGYNIVTETSVLLSPTYDALFDRHLITFENSGKIILSDQIQPSDFARIGVTGKEHIRKELSQGNKTFLQIHQQAFDKQLFT